MQTGPRLYQAACYCRRDVTCLTCGTWRALWRRLQARRREWKRLERREPA